MLLITIIVELRVIARRSRPRAGSRGLEKTSWVQHGHGKASVNQARPHCVNQMGKTRSKPLVARHDRGTARVQHAVCESALKGSW